MKRTFALIITLALLCGLTCCDDSSKELDLSVEQGQDNESEGTDTSGQTDLDDEDDEDDGGDGSSIVVYKGGNAVSMNRSASFTIDIQQSVSTNKYMCIDLETDLKLLGTIEYCPVDDTSNVTTEYFYTEPTDEPLYQFLDFFRGVQGFSGDIYVLDMTFENVGSSAGTVTLNEISFLDREVTESVLYLENDDVKVGVNLNRGGAIHYFERKGLDVKQVYDSSGYGYIISGDCPDGCKVAYNNVNLLNNADTGRLLQQSYYGEMYSGVYWNDEQWSYNPVQGGSSGNYPSQIVDYRVSDTEIYTKCIPLDWSIAEKTRSYMENWITLEADGVVKVHNRYTDYTGMNHRTPKDQELPALYVPFLFKTFVCYEGDSPFTGAELYRNSLLGFWGSQVGEGFSSKNVTEQWSAWVNDDDFGFGIFVPGLVSVKCGRYPGGSMNVSYDEETFDNALKIYGSEAAGLSQTDYTTHKGAFYLPTYGVLEYNFFFTANDLEVMREIFNGLYGTETNTSLEEWISVHS